MSSRPIVPCLWLDDQAEEAASFYTETFPDGRVIATSHYPDSFENPGGKPEGSVLTVEFEIANQRFTALNGGPRFVMGPSISFFVHVPTSADADALYERLVQGGQVLMPLDEYPWSKRYAWVEDRFRVSWQIITGLRSATGATIVPCLMFAGHVHGQAEAAMHHYSRIFPNARIEGIERYASNEGPEGTVKHGLFVIADQEMIAMDSHVSHDVTFNEALSLQVMCDDQAEIDRYWTLLSEGGQEQPCGWLKDRFGVSWQVVPSAIVEWMTHPDSAARDRAFAALMRMKKLDIAMLRAALDSP